MAKVYTHNYMDYYNELAQGGKWNFEIADKMIERFEREAKEHLMGIKDDVGAVVLYYDNNGDELAYFDYENCVGSVYALGGTRADEC